MKITVDLEKYGIDIKEYLNGDDISDLVKRVIEQEIIEKIKEKIFPIINESLNEEIVKITDAYIKKMTLDILENLGKRKTSIENAIIEDLKHEFPRQAIYRFMTKEMADKFNNYV